MLDFLAERAAQALREIAPVIYRESLPLSLEFQRGDADWQSISPGFSWFGAEESAWLRGGFTVPKEWAGERVGLWIEIDGSEPLLFVDNLPVQALDYNHQDVLLYTSAAGGESHSITIDAYARTAGTTATLKSADLVMIDRTADGFYYDLLAASQLLMTLPQSSRTFQNLQIALESALNRLDFTGGIGSATFYDSLTGARAALAPIFAAASSPDARDPEMLCAGHAHIDVAWLWSLPNTRKKCGRTFATALRLMDEFPEYHFTQSQPQLYQYVKEDYPDFYARIKIRIAEGRWEPTGGMWVEADCNIPSGESLIRQILHGNRFFAREFGITTKIMWLPDVFGYPASLPQIFRGCGMTAFMTTKISWSQFNRMPADTFRWRGIDGTEILTHFVTTNSKSEPFYTFNGQLTAEEIQNAWESYRQKAINPELLNLFGWGDGGGGATRQMLESGRRFATIPGLPHCTFGRADDYFERLESRVGCNPLLPRWSGELYLEYHRGTYTSQAALKKANRKCEILFRNAEIFSVLAKVEAGLDYPHESLNTGWEKILLNQFHDILPGSSIKTVNEQAKSDYAAAATIGETALNNALDTLAARVPAPTDTVLLFNPTDTLRPADVARIIVPPSIAGDLEFADDGVPLAAQRIEASNGMETFLVVIPEVGALGYQSINVGRAGGGQEGSPLTVTSRQLENEFVRVSFDEAGEIVSLIHKVMDEDDEDATIEREVIAPNQSANALILYEDKPMRYDAWDIDIYYQNKSYPLREIGTIESITVVESGPVRAGIEIRHRFLQSVITQRVYLYVHSPRIEFETEVDWQERQMLLKAEFPVAVNANFATYEIQFGATERPTHENTSWDRAKFEVCHHKWMDLSEGDYGVSLLNDCKYGGDIHGNTLRLTLLKGAISPDLDADRGHHLFIYALLPHTGDWRSETLDEAFALNYPLLTRFIPADRNRRNLLPARYALATVDDQGLIIDTIKEAEEGGGIIIRLYESFNTRGRATLTLGFAIASAFAVNLVEGEPKPIAHDSHSISFEYRPFEIKTFLVQPRVRGK